MLVNPGRLLSFEKFGAPGSEGLIVLTRPA